ncbi:MAG: BrnA antitoxin family protein [Polaromonas sp.]
MVSRLPVIDEDGEVGDLSEVDTSLFRPAHEVLPPELQKTLGMRMRGPQKAPPKVSTTIRLSPEVVQAFRAGGEGWQTRIDAALKDWLRTHSPV